MKEDDMGIGIVTDSTSDIPIPLAESQKISVMSNIIIIDGRSYEDNIDISRQEFYERLPRMRTLPTTATVSSGAYQELYDCLFHQGYSQILSIHAPSLLSGIFNAASLAAQSFSGRVQVVDSGQVTMGLGFQVLVAAEDAARGLSMESILKHLADIRQRVHLYAMLDTLEYLHRSGRISWAKASLGSLLRIKPFIMVKEGKVLSMGEVRTRAKGILRLMELLKGLGPLERLAILHTNAAEEADQLLGQVENQLATTPLVLNVTTVIGTHAGPKALGFAAVRSGV